MIGGLVSERIHGGHDLIQRIIRVVRDIAGSIAGGDQIAVGVVRIEQLGSIGLNRLNGLFVSVSKDPRRVQVTHRIGLFDQEAVGVVDVPCSERFRWIGSRSARPHRRW